MRTNRPLLLLVLASALAGGCAGPELAPAPTLYWATDEHPYDDVPSHFQTPDLDLVYVTDREPIETDDASMAYGYRRSHALAMGLSTVRIGDEMTWDEIVEASTSQKRKRRIPMELTAIEEIAKLPASNTPRKLIDGERQDPPEYLEALAAGEAAFAQLVRERLALTPLKEVFIYVHGYANKFEDAQIRMATLWHYLGRQGVPIAYTWPAGHEGLFQGYNYDRESSEFTVFHLKQLIRILSSIEELDRMHIIAHSRGTDVVLTALRELWIEVRYLDQQPRLLANVIIAAADIDWQVLQQRISAERLPELLDAWVFYMSTEDKAIGIAEWLFSSLARLGRITPDDLSLEQKESLRDADGVQVIDVRVKSGFVGHAYFVTNPAVLSDMILILRKGRPPGAENGRPLEPGAEGVFWHLDDRYLLDDPP